jgi:hypothetical protein
MYSSNNGGDVANSQRLGKGPGPGHGAVVRRDEASGSFILQVMNASSASRARMIVTA